MSFRRPEMDVVFHAVESTLTPSYVNAYGVSVGGNSYVYTVTSINSVECVTTLNNVFGNALLGTTTVTPSTSIGPARVYFVTAFAPNGLTPATPPVASATPYQIVAVTLNPKDGTWTAVLEPAVATAAAASTAVAALMAAAPGLGPDVVLDWHN